MAGVAEWMLTEKFCVTLNGGVLLSVTCTVNPKWPPLVGVPAMVPLAAFRLSPGGSAPLLIDQLYGGLPCCADSPAEYGLPAVPSGRLAVVMVSAGLIVALSTAVTLCGGVVLSVTLTVKPKLPALAGLPVMAPLAAFRLSPGGNAPLLTDQAYGGVPLSAASVAE